MTISDSEQPCKCCFGWTQWQPFKCFFIERMFVFFITLLLKKMGILNRFWKFYPFIEKKVLGKQLSKGLYSKYIFRLLHGPKFQIFFAELNMMVKVVKLFSGVLKAALMNFIGKRLYRNLIFSNVLHLQAKERLLHRRFPVSFTKYFRTFFLQNTSGWLLLLNTLFCLLTSATKNVFPSTLLISNIFETSTVNCLERALCGEPRQPGSCDQVDLLLTEQVISPKYCWKSEAVAQESSVKTKFCKTSHISQKSI